MATKTAVKKVKELSDQDLLKAPERDYMNDAQLAYFRQRLLELRAQLLNNADDTGQHLRENEITTDPSDRATLESIHRQPRESARSDPEIGPKPLLGKRRSVTSAVRR